MPSQKKSNWHYWEKPGRWGKPHESIKKANVTLHPFHWSHSQPRGAQKSDRKRTAYPTRSRRILEQKTNHRGSWTRSGADAAPPASGTSGRGGRTSPGDWEGSPLEERGETWRVTAAARHNARTVRTHTACKTHTHGKNTHTLHLKHTHTAWKTHTHGKNTHTLHLKTYTHCMYNLYLWITHI